MLREAAREIETSKLRLLLGAKIQYVLQRADCHEHM